MECSPNIILSGGPPPSDGERVRYVENPQETLKLFRGQRYDHFEPTGVSALHDGHALAVFAYTGFTCVAE